MKSADCPFGAAAGVRAQLPTPSLVFPEHVQRVMKLLAIGVGFVCGCWLGMASPPPHESWSALVPIVGKSAPLVAGVLLVRRRRVRPDHVSHRGWA
jgi:hypothetical protein